jgi:hypothetical protein
VFDLKDFDGKPEGGNQGFWASAISLSRKEHIWLTKESLV